MLFCVFIRISKLLSLRDSSSLLKIQSGQHCHTGVYVIQQYSFLTKKKKNSNEIIQEETNTIGL